MHDSGPDDPDRFLIFATKENLPIQYNIEIGLLMALSKLLHIFFYQIYTTPCLCQDATFLMAYFFWDKKVDQPIKELYKF